MKKHLLYTSHYENSLAEIKAAGGRVTHKFSNQVFVAHLPESANESDLKHSSVEQLSGLDEVSSLLINAWKELEANPGEPVEKDGESFWDSSHAHIVEDSSLIPVWYGHEGRGKQMAKPGEPPSPYTEQLVGTVVVGIIIVSGPKNLNLNFTTAEGSKVVQQFVKACDFLAEKGGTYADLTFVFDIQKPSITATPLGNCISVEQCEAVYRDPALAKMGFQDGMAGITDYVTDLISRTDKAQWGFAAFVSKYPFASNGSVYADWCQLCLKYNFSWPGGDFSTPLMANICHLFGASFESSASNCTCEPAGLYNVPNTNCANCSDSGFFDMECLMRTQKLFLCPWTMGQIGWYQTNLNGDPVIISYKTTVAGNVLLLAYKDAGDSISILTHSVLGWKYDNLGFRAGTAPVASGEPRIMPISDNSLHVFFRNQFRAIVDIFCTDTECIFADISALSGGAPECAGNPSVLRYNSTYWHVTYRSINKQIIDLVFDGKNWRRWANLSDLVNAVPAAGDPYIIQFGTSIDVVYRSENGAIIDITWRGDEWNAINLTQLAKGSPPAAGDPCIIQNGTSFHVIYRDINGDISDIIWDGKNWQYKNLNEDKTGRKAAGDPRVTLFNTNDLYVVYRDINDHVSLYYFLSAQQKWFYGDLSGSDPGIIGNPSITSNDQQINVVYRSVTNRIFDIFFYNGAWSFEQLVV